MNICIMADLIVRSGVGNYIKNLARELANDNNVIVVSGVNTIGIDQLNSIKYYNLVTDSKNPNTVIKNVKKLHKILKENNIEIVHVNHRMSGFFMKVHNFLYKKIPTVWTVHTQTFSNQSLSAKIMMNKCDRVIAISEETADTCDKIFHINKNKIRLVYNGVDDKELTGLTENEIKTFKYEHDIADNKFIFCMHSRIDKVKGYDVVVNALKTIDSEIRERIIIICSGETNGEYYEKLKHEISDGGGYLFGNFRFVGWSNPRIIFGISKAALMPSYREGFPLSAAEAMLMKVLVLRSKTGGYTAMKNYVIGSEIGDSDGLAKQMEDIIRNYDNYIDMIEKAYDFSKNNFTLDVMVGNTVKVYDELIG